MSARTNLGKTMIIVNPTAQSGAAATAAKQVQRFLSMYMHDDRAFDLVNTTHPRHAAQIASQATGYNTVLALGGDGLVHETACGLMAIEPASRPCLGVLPVGSGNDYARTLGMDQNMGADLSWLSRACRRTMDVGRIDYAGEAGRGTDYFVQTFSCGLDAAIAIGTYELRKSTGLSGDALYLASGLNVFGIGYRRFPLRVKFEDQAWQELESIIMAVQIGPTYGSGFRICPDADPSDGIFDICYAHGKIPRAIALPVFLRAKNGHHLSSRYVHTRRAQSVRLLFDGEDYPLQADGEQIRARSATITMVPGALTVLAPRAGLNA